MPFSSAPIAASRPFDLSGSDPLDRRRALLCLTQAVYYEAGYEPLEGRRAVAQVVLNRMRHPAFPKSICGVVYQGARDPVCQFSFVCDGSLYRRPALGAWQEAERIAAAALDGFVERSVGAATHYHADYVAPYWAPRLAKIVADRRAYLLSLAGRLGFDRRLHRPLHRRAGRPAGASPAAAPGGPDRRHASFRSRIRRWPARRLPRAENDVGGLLDTSKGWTLNIPMPSETGSATKSIADTSRSRRPEPAAPVDAGGSLANGQARSWQRFPSFPPPTQRRREPLTGARLIIVSVAIGFAHLPAVGDAGARSTKSPPARARSSRRARSS